MDVHVATMRRHAADALTKACKPTLPVTVIARVLGFVQKPGLVATDDADVLPGCSRPAGTCGKHMALVRVCVCWENKYTCCYFILFLFF